MKDKCSYCGQSFSKDYFWQKFTAAIIVSIAVTPWLVVGVVKYLFWVIGLFE